MLCSVYASGLLWQLPNKAAAQLICLPTHTLGTAAKDAPQHIHSTA